MNTFDFDTITPGEAFALQPDDVVLFHGGPGRLASASFDAASGDITVAFGGRSVVFDPGVTNVSVNGGLHFDDGSTLIVGGPRNEAVSTGDGDDALFGNAGDDTLLAHGGNNLLQGNQGDDVLIAGAGSDTVYGGQGNDVIVSGLGVGAEAGDFVNGNKGDDSLTGSNGNDILLGGQGNDSIQGGGGDDWMSGDLGDDTLAGGAGGDVFFVFAGSGDDRVLDFNDAEGDRVRVQAGTAFEIHQFGADTIILVDHGSSTITLVGIQASSLHADWVVNV